MFANTTAKYGILMLIVIVFAQVIAEENEDEYAVVTSGKCNSILKSPAGKMEFNDKNSSLSCNFTIKPNKPENVTQIHILLEKMVIDDGDIVTVKTVALNGSDSEVILGSFHARPDAFVLITGVKELVVELNTSKREVKREFAASYQSQACTFSIHDDIPRISQPIYAPNVTELEPCDLSYDVKVDPNVTFAFSFEVYNLSKSSIGVTGAMEFHKTTFDKGDKPPPDFLADSGQLQLDVSMDPHTPSDNFVLYRHQTYSACSGFVPIEGKPTFVSPSLPKLIDQNVPKECHWHFTTGKSEALGVKFKNMSLEDNFDVVTIIDGLRTAPVPLFQATRTTQNSSLGQVIRTSSPDLILVFKPQSFSSNIAFDVFSAGSGKYLQNDGTFKATSISDRINDTVFLLEVPEGKNVAVKFTSYSLVSPAEIEIYEDFTRDSRKIARLKSEVWYPIMSSTSKLMIAAVNFAKGEFAGEFGSAEGCMHMSPGTSDSYVLYGNCETTCAWIIPPVDYKGVLLLDLQYLALDVNDLVTVLHLDKNKTVVASITSTTHHVPQLSLDTAVGAYVNVTRGKCTRKTDDVVLVARADYLPDCSQSYTLSPSDELQLTSPSYPDTYPLFTHCNSSIKQSSKGQMLHLAFEKLELASDHCIQISYVSENESSTFSVTGNQMPDDFILKGEVSVLFNSGSCNTTKGVSTYASKQGFLLNVTAMSCGGVITIKAGTLTFPVNTSICIFKLNVPASETDGSSNFIIYSIEEGKSGNYKLQVHDGPTVRDEVINNNTEASVWSRTNSLIFVYKRLDGEKPSASVTVKYHTESCNKTSQCDNGICMHPDWRCNGKNDCGDYSDEKDCQFVPPHNDPDVKSSISPAAFGICIVIFFLFGVGMTLCTPWALQKYRNRYRPFQDLSVIE